MPYTVTVIATKPLGTRWWGSVPGSSDYIAREELFAWIAQQPGFISVTHEATEANVSKNVLVFDTEANYAAYNAAMVQQPAAIARAADISAGGVTWTSSAVAT